MEEFSQYEHTEKQSSPLHDFPLDHPDVTLNKSIEDPNEFEEFMVIFSKHKDSSSPLTDDGGDAMITE